MHTGFAVEFDHAWLAGRDMPREREDMQREFLTGLGTRLPRVYA